MAEPNARTAWTIRTKLLVCFGLVLGCTLISTGIAIYMIQQLQSDIRDRLGLATKKLDYAGQIGVELREMRMTGRGVVLFTVMKHGAEIEQERDLFRRAVSNLGYLTEGIERSAATSGELKSVAAIRAGAKQYSDIFDRVVQLCAEGDLGQADRLSMQASRPIAGSIQAAAGELARAQRESSAATVQTAASYAAKGIRTMILLGLACLAAAAIALAFVNGVSQALRKIAEAVASGSTQVSEAARQIRGSSQTLARDSFEQASSLEETSAASQQISAMSYKNAENSRLAAKVVSESTSKFQSTERVLEEMKVTIERMNSASEKVSKILRVIDEIAFQTNILALNAAVEAARAGEAGSGFAVVADEVRHLAQRSAQASRDTAALIEESVRISREGREKLRGVPEAIQTLTADAAQVKLLVEEVSAESEEQASKTEQISMAIAHVGQLTQRTAAQAEQSASASKELAAQAVLLEGAVEQLTGMAGRRA